MEIHIFSTRFRYQDWAGKLMRNLKQQGTYFKFSGANNSITVYPPGESRTLLAYILDPTRPDIDRIRGLKAEKLVIHSNHFSNRQIVEMEAVMRVKHEKAYSWASGWMS